MATVGNCGVGNGVGSGVAEGKGVLEGIKVSVAVVNEFVPFEPQPTAIKQTRIIIIETAGFVIRIYSSPFYEMPTAIRKKPC